MSQKTGTAGALTITGLEPFVLPVLLYYYKRYNRVSIVYKGYQDSPLIVDRRSGGGGFGDSVGHPSHMRVFEHLSC